MSQKLQIESSIINSSYKHNNHVNNIYEPFSKKSVFGNIFLNQKFDIYYFEPKNWNLNFNKFISKMVFFNSKLSVLWNDELSIHYDFSELDEDYKISEFLCFNKDTMHNIPHLSNDDDESEILNSYAFGNIYTKYCFVHYKNLFMYIHCSSK
jgi:hypothetical protein